MFEKIREKLKTEEGIRSMSKEELYYASLWLDLFEELPLNLYFVLAEECVMNLD